MSSKAAQAGFSLLEVMFASMILSVFVLGIGGYLYTAGQRTAELLVKEKALFALNAEMERVTALYETTAFAADLLNAPITTTGYDGLAGVPATRLVYPNDVSSFAGGGAQQNYITTSANNFLTGSEFMVWLSTNILPSLDRNYVWLDQKRNIVARLSWVTTNINVSSCVQAADCSCQRFDNLPFNGGRCARLDMYLDFPYRITSTGTIVPPANRQTISASTIVGRG